MSKTSSPDPGRQSSFGRCADRLWHKMLPVPFCFMGMGIFRAWTEMLYANNAVIFPAQTRFAEYLALPNFDAYSVFDFSSAVVLVVLALCARRLAPLCHQPWAVVATLICMVGSACCNFASIFFPQFSDALCIPAVLLGGIGIALILMLWSEFFGCINPLRVAIYYSASIVVGALITWAFKGMNAVWMWIGTCLVPIVSMLCLWRAYATLPHQALPQPYRGDFSFPWKPVLVVAVYTFAYALRGTIFSQYFAMNSGVGAILGALAVYVILCVKRESIDFNYMWKIALALMIVSLAPLESAMPSWAVVADFFALASYTIMLIFIMVILSNLCYRYGACALWLFAIERAVRLTASQSSRIIGATLDISSLPLWQHTLISLILAALLVLVAVFMFSERQVSSPWGVVLKRGNRRDGRDNPANRLGTRCRELARTYDLTAREEEVLLLLARHKQPTQIAAELYIGKSTVKTHVKHLYQKLDIHTRADLLELVGYDGPGGVQDSTDAGSLFTLR